MRRTPGKAFKMSKEIKRQLAANKIAGKPSMKLEMIDAQLASEVIVKSRKEREADEAK